MPLTPNEVSKLLDEQGAALILYARQWCSEPEDAVQNGFVKLMKQTPPPVNPTGWLYRVVRNEAVSASRRSRRRSARGPGLARDAEAWFSPAVENSLDAATVAGWLERLEGVQREVIVMKLWSDLTYEQIAEVTGVSTSSAHRHFVAGLQRLRGMDGDSRQIKSQPIERQAR